MQNRSLPPELLSRCSETERQQLNQWAQENDIIGTFLGRYSPERLHEVMSQLTSSGIIASCKNTEEIAYLFKDLAPTDPNSWHQQPYSTQQLAETLDFVKRKKLLRFCRDGWQVRDLLSDLKKFDINTYNQPDSPLSTQRLTTLVNIHGEDNEVSLQYLQSMVAPIIERIQSAMTPHYTIGEALSEDQVKLISEWLDSLRAIDNFTDLKNIKQRLTTLLGIGSYEIRIVIPWIISTNLWEKPSVNNDFSTLLTQIGRLSNETLLPILTFLDKSGIITRSRDIASITKFVTELRDYSYDDCKDIISWFEKSAIMQRCKDMAEVSDTLAILKLLIKKGATVSAAGITGINVDDIFKFLMNEADQQEKESPLEWRNAAIFYLAENHREAHGDNWTSTHDFGNLVGHLYQKTNVSHMTTHLFSTLPASPNKRVDSPIGEIPTTLLIVYNNEGYNGVDRQVKFRLQDQTMIGNPLPQIGYNICLPKNREIKGVMVEAYGGYSSVADAYIPGQILHYSIALLNRGIALVTLNLPDLTGLKNHQSAMPSDLHQKIHSCIDQFHRVLKDSPEQLHSILSCLKHKKIFLSGASFGGRTALRHAEMYPGTFSGYISHDGAINEYDDTLSAGKPTEIAKIDDNDAILLLHNTDDNIVNVLESLTWYDKAKELGKKVTISICDHGNPFPKKGGHRRNPDQDDSRDHDVYKGHYIPTHIVDHQRYIDTIYHFMLHGAPKHATISVWRAHKHTIYAKKAQKNVSVIDLFLSESLRLYKADLLSASEASDLCTPISIRDQARREEAWTQIYAPLFRAISFASLQVANLIDSNPVLPICELTDDNIDRALARQAPQFIQYLLETEKGLTGVKIETAQLQSNAKELITPAWRESFRKMLNDTVMPVKDDLPNKPFATFIMQTFYQANHHLVTEERHPLSQEEMCLAKQKLFNMIETEIKLTKATSREMLASAVRSRPI